MNRIDRPDHELPAADADLLGTLRALQETLRLTSDQIGRLVDALEGARGLAPAVAAKLSVNWVIGPPDNLGWAYGNNAKRIAKRLGGFTHAISSERAHDIAVYFDLKVAERFPVEARYQVLRIGGPRPLDELCGDDVEALRASLARFDAVVALSGELKLRAMQVHPNVHLVPNALDVDSWKPFKPKFERGFTFGFAASLKSSAEADVKGYDLAQKLADHFAAPLLVASKGKDQLTNERMYRDFYGRIECLLHPVAAGREGTSNVVMEALAAGVPVLTTPHAGFHGEFLVHRRSALLCERDFGEMAAALAELAENADLRRRLAREGRAFAERNHDIRDAARAYEGIFRALATRDAIVPDPVRKTIAFVPFWEPMDAFGSSRLRAQYPGRYLTHTRRYDIVYGYDAAADIVVVVQSCADEVLRSIKRRPDQFVIYDVCDKYYENERIFRHLEPPVSSLRRFEELCARADLIIVPSAELKVEIASRVRGKPVQYVPEPIDYGGPGRRYDDHHADKVVLWFGNPDRGNFESAKWMIDHLWQQHGYTPLLVSRQSFFKRYPEYMPFVTQWSLDAMREAFAKATLAVVAYHAAEQAKSPNRFVSAIMNGVPTIVSGSPAVRDILKESGHEFASVGSPRRLDRALAKLERAEFRHLFVKRLQTQLRQSFGEEAVTAAYAEVIERKTWRPGTFSRPRRVGFISHNLALGEGAPWSLFELVVGLRAQGVIEPHVFSPGSGALIDVYRNADIPVTVFEDSGLHAVKALNTRFVGLRNDFLNFLRATGVEVVIGNTVKSAPLVDMARAEGLKAAMIVRESYGREQRFAHFRGDARLHALNGITEAEEIVFVAETSREMWADQPFRGNVTVIRNGVSPERFSLTPGSAAGELRTALGFAPEDVVAVCVGTVNVRKGQGELVAAFAGLPEAVRSRARLMFVGATANSHLAGFLAELEALPPATRSRIGVVEAVEDIAPYYVASDIFLMNSSSEAYPRSVVEALYFGLPVLSTPVFGVKEQVVPGRSGFLYEFNAMGEWQALFARLVDDGELRGAMGHEASRAFWKLTGYQEMLHAYKAVLARLLQ